MDVRRLPKTSELYHHGIRGQKWGVRRYQNADRSLTPAGKARYSKNGESQSGFREISPETKKKLKIAAAAVAGLTLVGASAYLGYKYGMKVPKTSKKPKIDLSKKTDEELGKMIKRMKLEKQINELSKEPKRHSHIKLNDSMTKVANATIYTTLAGTTGYLIRSAITGEQDSQLLADYIAPKPGGGKKKR